MITKEKHIARASKYASYYSIKGVANGWLVTIVDPTQEQELTVFYEDYDVAVISLADHFRSLEDLVSDGGK